MWRRLGSSRPCSLGASRPCEDWSSSSWKPEADPRLTMPQWLEMAMQAKLPVGKTPELIGRSTAPARMATPRALGSSGRTGATGSPLSRIGAIGSQLSRGSAARASNAGPPRGRTLGRHMM
eukprot:694329-Amphidinium_carterae.1